MKHQIEMKTILEIENQITPLMDDATEAFWDALDDDETGCDVIEDLVKSGRVDINVHDENGQTILTRIIEASGYDTNEDIICRLIDLGANVNLAEKNTQMTPLHHAVKCRNESLVEMLIDYNANVHATDKNGKTPILCATPGDLDIIQLLMAKGASIVHKDVGGRSLLHHLILKNDDAEDEFLDYLKFLLPLFSFTIENSISDLINQQDNQGNSTLHYAAKRQFSEILEYLIEKGANLDLQNNKGQTFLVVSIMDQERKNSNYTYDVSERKRDLLSDSQLYIKHGADISSLLHPSLIDEFQDMDFIYFLLKNRIDIHKCLAFLEKTLTPLQKIHFSGTVKALKATLTLDHFLPTHSLTTLAGTIELKYFEKDNDPFLEDIELIETMTKDHAEETMTTLISTREGTIREYFKKLDVTCSTDEFLTISRKVLCERLELRLDMDRLMILYRRYLNERPEAQCLHHIVKASITIPTDIANLIVSYLYQNPDLNLELNEAPDFWKSHSKEKAVAIQTARLELLQEELANEEDEEHIIERNGFSIALNNDGFAITPIIFSHTNTVSSATSTVGNTNGVGLDRLSSNSLK